MKLSVLDQSVIRAGGDARDAFRETVRLAKWAEELGYERFWVAEHHNTNGIAGTAPEILIAHIASLTEKIRVGSGGVLLPQYSPYKIAEDFKVLEALFPGRMDLGIGRSPGGGADTRLALTDGIRRSLNEFPRQVRDLQGFLTESLPEDHMFKGVTAYPSVDSLPEIWMLGITQRGARLAAENGTAFTYGHFITPVNGKRALDYYYEYFQPSSLQRHPKANICIFVVCAPTQEEAEELALSQDMWLLDVEQARDTRIHSVAEAKSRSLSSAQRARVQENRKRAVIGTPEKVREELKLLSEIYRTDEFMIITNIHDTEAKSRSYSLISQVMQNI
ncbi:LLM class flavin-dependent oxidoreductase [Peribacillus kribbensis]|uniref:LLM class flavin-dependent oxidoreductase n=1 Tax=Peribacillus kribbensis TaxID=356658 RepID=UPI000425D00A|nr:LLM class flavin-dependent oxidoreductase [Peribacillus kribbensis]